MAKLAVTMDTCPMPFKKTKNLEKGYTLLELALVLAILSLLAAGIMSVATQNIRRTKQQELNTKLNAIETALINFRQLNSRLPCPGDATYLVTNQYFGVEGVNTGACTTGSTYSSGNRTVAASPGPTANFSNGNTVAGMVPVKTLGLSDEYAFDPWGGRFMYAVDARITAASAFTTYTVTNTSIGSITVKDASGASRTTQAAALLLSFGPNGHGAYQLSGVRKNNMSTNSDELANCHCSSTATANSFDGTFVQHKATDSNSTSLSTFDDIMRFYMRSQILSYSESSR